MEQAIPRSSSPISKLPPELLDKVFSLSSLQHLKHYALVCDMWKQVSRRWLFKHVVVESVPRANRCCQFLAASSIFPYVVSLELHHTSISTECISVLALGRILHQLPQLHTLVLSIHWHPCDLQEALEASQLQPVRLQYLRVTRSVSDDNSSVFSLFRLFGEIAHLALNLNLLNVPPQGLPALYTGTQVRHLQLLDPFRVRFGVGFTVSDAAMLQHIIAVDALDSIDYRYCGDTKGKELDVSWPSLSTLKVKQYMSPVSGEYYPSLKLLHIEGVTVYAFLDSNSVFSSRWLSACQSLLGAAACLEQYTLYLTVYPVVVTLRHEYSFDVDSITRSVKRLDWAPFTDAVRAHPQLGTINIVICVPTCSEGYEEIQESLNNVMPPLLSPTVNAQKMWRFTLQCALHSLAVCSMNCSAV